MFGLAVLGTLAAVAVGAIAISSLQEIFEEEAVPMAHASTETKERKDTQNDIKHPADVFLNPQASKDDNSEQKSEVPKKKSAREESIEKIIEMGFSRTYAIYGLNIAEGDLSAAVSHLLSLDQTELIPSKILIKEKIIEDKASEEHLSLRNRSCRPVTIVQEQDKTTLDSDVAQLVEMGFNASDALSALHRSDGNVEEAIKSLLTSQNVPKQNPESPKDNTLSIAPLTYQNSVDEIKLKQLTAMGFQLPDSYAALLATNNDIRQSIKQILSNPAGSPSLNASSSNIDISQHQVSALIESDMTLTQQMESAKDDSALLELNSIETVILDKEMQKQSPKAILSTMYQKNDDIELSEQAESQIGEEKIESSAGHVMALEANTEEITSQIESIDEGDAKFIEEHENSIQEINTPISDELQSVQSEEIHEHESPYSFEDLNDASSPEEMISFDIQMRHVDAVGDTHSGDLEDVELKKNHSQLNSPAPSSENDWDLLEDQLGLK